MDLVVAGPEGSDGDAGLADHRPGWGTRTGFRHHRWVGEDAVDAAAAPAAPVPISIHSSA